MLLPHLRHREYQRLRLIGQRVYLRAPLHRHWRAWSRVRRNSRSFLTPWEPEWSPDALTRRAFRRRLRHYQFEWRKGIGFSFLVFRRSDNALLGGITLGNVRLGVAQTGSLGYWIAEAHARQGYMSEAIVVMQNFAFDHLGLHRLEAACLPHNEASRGLLEKSGFHQEGYARGYLQIAGEWRDHLLFAKLRTDPRVAGETRIVHEIPATAASTL